jgi:signal transduction histidine kinase
MFTPAKRQERRAQALHHGGNRLKEALIEHVSQGVFLVDHRERILQPVSRSMAALFRRRDFTRLTFAKLLEPHATEAALGALAAELAEYRAGTPAVFESSQTRPVELRLPRPDGAFDVVHYCFEFFPVSVPEQPLAWMVRVTDRTLQIEQARELDELRPQLAELRAEYQFHGEVLRTLLLIGRGRFANAVQTSRIALKAIKAILKKPAREAAAFRAKLQEILVEVTEIRRASASLQLSGLDIAARRFEAGLRELGKRGQLSGNDFVPIAVQLDQLFEQIARLRTLTASLGATKAARRAATGAAAVHAGADHSGAVHARAPLAGTAPPGVARHTRHAAAAGLERTLASMTEHVALENHKSVTLKCIGLERVPAAYLAPIKNVAIQLIRNSLIHGIEAPTERALAGKPPVGSLVLRFNSLADGNFELRFEDDGRGIDAAVVRRTAVERKLMSPDAVERLRDRQAIKLIFKDGFTTLPPAEQGPAHGSGLSFVRRYVHDAGGKVSLASELGRETRFKVSLPAVDKSLPIDPEAPSDAEAQVA